MTITLLGNQIQLHVASTLLFFLFDLYTDCSFTVMQIFQLIMNFFRKPLKE